jgi:predicted transcriptional regulator
VAAFNLQSMDMGTRILTGGMLHVPPVRERELARAVEALEMEQPEAEARVQSVINAMTDSLTDDPPAEREQTIMQLEDELEQAEENKSALAEKLSTNRLTLRRVRRRLDREGLFSSASAQCLPPHLIKVLK